MNFNVTNPGSFSTLSVHLNQGEQIKAESGAMVSMSSNLDVGSTLGRGFWKGLYRKFFVGESLFFQTVKAERDAGDVMLAPSNFSTIEVIDLDGDRDYFLQKGGFLAAEPGIEITGKRQKIKKGLFSGAGFFLMRLSGKGKVAISAYSGIQKLVIEKGESRVIDNHHLVAWHADADYKIERAAKGFFSSAASGEGFICRVNGPCEVYIQTRSAHSPGRNEVMSTIVSSVVASGLTMMGLG